MKAFNGVQLVNLPISTGATTPVPTSEAGTIIWSTTSNLALCWTGASWQPASGAGASSLTRGTAVVDFGAFPGKDVARVTVGAAGVAASSVVSVSLRPVATALHSEDEHLMLQDAVRLSVPRSSIVAGASFQIVAMCSDKSKMWGALNVDYWF